MGDSSSLLDQTPIEEEIPANASIWSINYYRHFFDVSTKQIMSRLLRAFIPFGKLFYHEEDKKADL